MAVCVISGSASGIGAATRRRCETAGDRVVGIDLDPEPGQRCVVGAPSRHRDAEVVRNLLLRAPVLGAQHDGSRADLRNAMTPIDGDLTLRESVREVEERQPLR